MHIAFNDYCSYWSGLGWCLPINLLCVKLLIQKNVACCYTRIFHTNLLPLILALLGKLNICRTNWQKLSKSERYRSADNCLALPEKLTCSSKLERLLSNLAICNDEKEYLSYLFHGSKGNFAGSPKKLTIGKRSTMIKFRFLQGNGVKQIHDEILWTLGHSRSYPLPLKVRKPVECLLPSVCLKFWMPCMTRYEGLPKVLFLEYHAIRVDVIIHCGNENACSKMGPKTFDNWTKSVCKHQLLFGHILLRMSLIP